MSMLNSKERRKIVEELLVKATSPLKGQYLAGELGVTRQIIVKDIALLRAGGVNIIATPDGYIIPRREKEHIRKMIVVSHPAEQIEDELQCVVKFGGKVIDVIIEHPLYGEMRGMLMVRTLYDIQNFMNKLNEYKAEPLLVLTGGVHIHTIEAENEEVLENILHELECKGYLIKD